MDFARDLNDPAYTKWRKRVFMRDRWKCKMPGCPRTCLAVEAHHIIRWADCVNLRFVVSNGITLCKTCHESIKDRESEYVDIFRDVLAKQASERGGPKWLSKTEKLARLDIMFSKFK